MKRRVLPQYWIKISKLRFTKARVFAQGTDILRNDKNCIGIHEVILFRYSFRSTFSSRMTSLEANLAFPLTPDVFYRSTT